MNNKMKRNRRAFARLVTVIAMITAIVALIPMGNQEYVPGFAHVITTIVQIPVLYWGLHWSEF